MLTMKTHKSCFVDTHNTLIFFFKEGRISEAESLKLKLEQAQRDRRLQMEKELKEHFPAFFSKAQNKWNFNQDYWVQRNNGKFGNLLDLW